MRHFPSTSRAPRAARVLAAAAALALLAAAGCGGKSSTAPPTAAGARLGLSLNTTDSSLLNPTTFPDSMLDALNRAKAAGVTVLANVPQWSVLEPTPGNWNLGEATIYFDVVTSLGFRTYLNLRILDTGSRNVPPDVAALAWDDTAMIRRVDVVVDTLAAYANRYRCLAAAFGNEVDAYFGQHPAEFGAFLALYRREVVRFHALAPGVPIGIVTTNPLANPAAVYGDSLNVTSDVVLHTFYPSVPGSFDMKPVATFDADLEAVVARANGKPVAFQEVGFSSDPLVNGSPASQAEAVRRFRTWLARQPSSRVPFASWFLYTDWTAMTLNTLFGYYGFNTPEFGAFLGSLGLRDSLGRAKPAWEEFRTPR